MTRSNVLRIAVGFLVAAFFAYFAFKGISLSTLVHDSLQANAYVLLATAVIVVMGHIIRAIRWRIILRELKTEISLVDAWGSITVGYLINNFIPQFGELARGFVTGRLEKTSVSGVFGTMVLERLFDMLSSGVLFGSALFFYRGTLIESFPILRVVGTLLIAGSLSLGALLYISSTSEKLQRAITRFVEFVVPRRFVGRAESALLSFLSSFRLLRSGKKVGTISFYTSIMWIIYVLSIYVPFFAFPFGSQLHPTLFDAFLLMLVSSVAWNLPSPGGIGVYHLFVSQALVIISGVPKVEALVYASITFLLGYLEITIVGSIFVFIFSRRLDMSVLSGLMKQSAKTEA